MEVLPVAAGWVIENLSLGKVLKSLGIASLLVAQDPIVRQLGPRLSKNSSIIIPSSPNFESAIQRWQEAFQAPKLTVVVNATTAEDAQAAVRYAFEQGRPWIARNGGHGATSALGSITNGIQIDMRSLNKVELSDDGTTAAIGAGARIGELVSTLHAMGKRAVTGICECVGLSGALLGGGHGWLQGQYGLMIDQILEANMVLPNGTAVTVSESSHPDLFWAIRGAGHNFGLVTEYKYKVYNTEPDHQWSYEFFFFTQDKLEDIYSLAQDIKSSQPATATHWAYWVMLPFIDPIHPTILYMVINDGSASATAAQAKPFKDLGPAHTVAGQATMPELAALTYMGMDTEGCARGNTVLRFANVVKDYNVTALRKVYNDFDEMITMYPAFNGSFYMLERYSTEAVKAVPGDSTAFAHRDYDLVYTSALVYKPDPKLDPVALAYGRKIRHHVAQGSDDPAKWSTYVNYALGDEPLGSIYGWDEWRMEKLKSVKKEYDPENVMRWYNPIV